MTPSYGMPALKRLPSGPRKGSLRQPEISPAVLPPRLRIPAPLPEKRWPDPPAGWPASEAEWRIYWAHAPLGRGPEGGVWFFQSPILLGRTGFVPDFIEEDLAISIDVIDERDGLAETQAIHVLREVIMQAAGYRHVAVDAALALANPIASLREALNGQSVGRID